MRLFKYQDYSVLEGLENSLVQIQGVVPTQVQVSPGSFIQACNALGSAYNATEKVKLRILKPNRFIFVDIVPNFALTEPIGIVYSGSEVIAIIELSC